MRENFESSFGDIKVIGLEKTDKLIPQIAAAYWFIKGYVKMPATGVA